MKKIILISLLLLFIPVAAWSQGTCVNSGGNLSYPFCAVEDAAETAAKNLLAVGTVRRDTAASSAGTSGDNATLNTDATGRLWTTISSNVAEGATISTTDVVMLGCDYASTNVAKTVACTSAGKLQVTAENNAEDSAHGSADTGVPILTRRMTVPATSCSSSGEYATLDTSDLGAVWTEPLKQRITTTTTLTVTAGGYTALDVIGGEQALTLGRDPLFSGVIRSIVVADNAAQGKNLRFHFFDAEAASNIADNGAFTPVDADLLLYAGNCTVSQHAAFTDNGVSWNNDCNLHIDAAAAAIDYYIEALEAPTYAATSDVTVTIVVERD